MTRPTERPRGLRAAKRARVEAVAETADAGADTDADATTDTGAEHVQIALPDVDEDGHEVSEMEQAHAMVSSAIALLDGEDGEENESGNDDGSDVSRQAQTLLQGAIHEYDRMLRASEAPDTFDSEFHRFYGDALRELGRVLHQSDFIEAALDRYSTALEKDPTNVKVLASMAAAHLQRASLLDDSTALLEAVDEAINVLTNERAAVVVPDACTRADLVATFGHQLHSLADAQEGSSLAQTLLIKVEGLFQSALQADSASHLAKAGMGLCFVSAMHMLPDSTAADDVVALADKAIAFLKDAVKEVAQTDANESHSRYLTWLAEALLVKMDLVLDDAEANEQCIEQLLRLASKLDQRNESLLVDFLNRGNESNEEEDDE